MLWGIAYGNITLWDGGTRGYIIWQNQIHIVYNIDRRIANSNILYVTLIFFFFFFFYHTGFPPYHTRSWSWSPFWSDSLIKTPQPHHESPGLWRVLSVFFFFATDRVFKRCWLIVVRISLYHSRRVAKGTLPFTVCQRKSQTRPQGIREGRLQAKPKRDVQRCWWRLVLFRYLNPMSLLLFKYQSALACATISLSGIN